MSVSAKALWYVESHLGSDLSLESIAGALGVSRYHLSRAFSLGTGCGVSQYIRGRRLSAAAKELLNGAPDILSVALEAGYGSHEAFTRAFRQHFGLTPELVRDQAPQLIYTEPIRMHPTTTVAIAPPRIVQQDAMLMFGLTEHYTFQNTAGMPSQWARFLPHLGHIKGQAGNVAYGIICNGDDANNFDYICAVQVNEFPSEPADFARLRLAPQTYAVFTHTGHISAIGATCSAVWNQALPASGRKAVDAPWLERYGEDFDGGTGTGKVEIWIPVAA